MSLKPFINIIRRGGLFQFLKFADDHAYTISIHFHGNPFCTNHLSFYLLRNIIIKNVNMLSKQGYLGQRLMKYQFANECGNINAFSFLV